MDDPQHARTHKHKEDEWDKDDPLAKEHYRKLYARTVELQRRGHIDIEEILSKNPSSRTHEERNHLAGYLQFKTNYFSSLKRAMIE